MELAMFLSVSDHLVCSFLKATWRKGLDLNGTHQFLVHNYYVNLMSGTIFGRLKSSRMLWHIKGYEFLTFWSGIMVPSLQSSSVSITAVRESQISQNFLQSVNSSITRRSVISIFTDVKISTCKCTLISCHQDDGQNFIIKVYNQSSKDLKKKKFTSLQLSTNKCTYIKFHIKTLKIAPTCFDPKIILRELRCSLLKSF